MPDLGGSLSARECSSRGYRGLSTPYMGFGALPIRVKSKKVHLLHQGLLRSLSGDIVKSCGRGSGGAFLDHYSILELLSFQDVNNHL